MAKIRMVGTSCEDDNLSGVFLDISFANGQTLLLPLTGKVHDPEFIRMFEDGRISRPKRTASVSIGRWSQPVLR